MKKWVLLFEKELGLKRDRKERSGCPEGKEVWADD